MKTEKAEVIREYFENGQLYSESYFLNRKRHNPNGPAYQEWYDNGQLKSESYFINGEVHNSNGPACREWWEDGEIYTKSYYLNGKELTKKEFEALSKPACNGKVVKIDGKKYKLTEI